MPNNDSVVKLVPNPERTGGGDGGDEDLKARIRALESHVSDVRIGMAKVETKLDHITEHMVTKGQLALYAFLTLIPVMGGGWWIVQQYLSPILKALPK